MTGILIFQNSSAQNQLYLGEDKGQISIQKDESGEKFLQSPDEGLWSVGTNWEEEWPSDWKHIKADSVENINGYLILHGKSEFGGGTLLLRDAYKKENGRIKCTRRWEWTGNDTLKKITLSVRFLSPEINNRLLMPGVIYYGNPAGKRSGNTPVFNGEAHEISFF